MESNEGETLHSSRRSLTLTSLDSKIKNLVRSELDLGLLSYANFYGCLLFQEKLYFIL